MLLHNGQVELARITQIGTDHGLLRAPVGVPPDGLVLASAERADLLVDFSDLEPGTELTLLNTAASPFDGGPFPAVQAESAADPDGLLPYPHESSRARLPAIRSLLCSPWTAVRRRWTRSPTRRGERSRSSSATDLLPLDLDERA